jgi:GntR family transcriptional regulator, transcriptional repressor for pyruvate dehydrogenase complex
MPSAPLPASRNGLSGTAYLDARSGAVRDILDRFQLREALECRAVFRSAMAPGRDLSAPREILPELDAAIANRDRQRWNTYELAFHRAIHDQGGNRLLAEMAEQAHREVQALSVRWLDAPPYGPGSLRELQAQHRALLEAIEAGDATSAVDRARAHMRFIRDAVIGSLSSSPRR